MDDCFDNYLATPYAIGAEWPSQALRYLALLCLVRKGGRFWELPRLRVGHLSFSFIYTQQRAAISLPSLAEGWDWGPYSLGSGLALGTLFTQIKEVYERYYLSSYHFPPEYLSLRGHTLYCIWSLSSKINQLAEESGVFPTGQYASGVNG